MAPSYIDLRSDTVTKPTPEMLEAVSHLDRSKLGDDVFGEDELTKEFEQESLTCWEKSWAICAKRHDGKSIGN
ncbi:MAG: hypothetical protein D0433_00115 [Candidatus Thermochlorobacter aerophilum]|uniref:Aromatic amino acid beta-eliminating lyase/threonine aldolase domain-containing protein n=1 Tax=Candidatus Thermochlorobacter aerophilus TaxID=1868324 RepID=A0A395M426_9BACT|nr:MAG: hypothetical protein D0433_00115 [Candidatus Thermochlorobacter aerophilum]